MRENETIAAPCLIEKGCRTFAQHPFVIIVRRQDATTP
jgi:hypothetical protein